MSQNSSQQSSFDKNLRSFLDAVAMFEREAGVVLDRLGLDTDAAGRVLDLLGAVSAEAIRPLAGALGIADTASVEALARDVRALLQSDARLRREQAASGARFDELLRAVESLGTTTAGLADLQARTQDRLDALAGQASGFEPAQDERRALAEEIAKLRARVDELETTLAETGIAAAKGSTTGDEPPAGIKQGGARRATPRSVTTAGGAHKILEGLPTLEPKLGPA